jgi:hypothetical protein
VHSADRVRIQKHLAVVEGELLKRDVSMLSEAQRANRTKHIRTLRAYREAGAFPHNHDFMGQRVPFFRDEHGTLCAMAYLIAQSGGRALVDRVATTDNNVYLPEIAADPELVAWLDANGLSAEEAARIQPTYGGTSSYERKVDPALVVSTAASVATIGWNILSKPNAEGHRSFAPGVVGILAGGLGFAAVFRDTSDDDETMMAVTLLSGAGAIIAGSVGIIRAARSRSVGIGTQPSQRNDFTPILQTDLRGRTKLGVQLRH